MELEVYSEALYARVKRLKCHIYRGRDKSLVPQTGFEVFEMYSTFAEISVWTTVISLV